jgi:Tol biopolymer transport system component
MQSEERTKMTTQYDHMRRVAGLARYDLLSWLARRARKNVVLAIVLAIVALSGGLPGAARAQSANQTVDGTLTVVNNGTGDQSDPHISGALVAYTSAVSGFSEIRYHNLLTGSDSAIPANGGLDFLPDVSGTTIVYTHLSAAGSAIDTYDTSTEGPPVELDSQPTSNRREPAIRNHTVAWVDLGFFASTAYPEIMAYDRTTQTATRLTDDLLYDMEPAVSPDGSVIVWTKCQTFPGGCYIWQATRRAGGWVTTRLQDVGGEEHNPDTNGQVVIYDSTHAGESDILWQPVGGGGEQRLSLHGFQHNPTISGNLVAFESFELATSRDIFLYDLTTGALFQLTQTLIDETLSDIAVAPDGQIRVVWTALEGTDANVYALTFRLPSPDTTPPSITISAPANTTYTLNQAVATSYSCADESGGSGLASCVGPVPSGSAIDTASVGAKTFTVNAADNAGNAASVSVAYNVIYTFSGFFQPVDNLPMLNAVKAGSALPVKFSLAGNQGLTILAAGYPKSQPIACDSAAPIDDIEQTVTAGGSSLAYDATNDQYRYVWKTDMVWAGSCHQLIVRLADGSDHRANFKFK